MKQLMVDLLERLTLDEMVSLYLNYFASSLITHKLVCE